MDTLFGYPHHYIFCKENMQQYKDIIDIPNLLSLSYLWLTFRPDCPRVRVCLSGCSLLYPWVWMRWRDRVVVLTWWDGRITSLHHVSPPSSEPTGTANTRMQEFLWERTLLQHEQYSPSYHYLVLRVVETSNNRRAQIHIRGQILHPWQPYVTDHVS